MIVNGPIALISDFDGTITADDFFWYTINEYLEESDLKPWHDYIDRKITHFQALSRIFGKIRALEEDFNDFIDRFPVEPKFIDTIELCNKKNIEFYIVSAGCDYYITRILKRIAPKAKYHLITNKSQYHPDFGLKFIMHDSDYHYYDSNVGVSKPKVVKDLKERGYYCIFAGDGRPDLPAAKLADIVFARKTLLDLCKEEGIKTEKFATYEDVYNFVLNLKLI